MNKWIKNHDGDLYGTTSSQQSIVKVENDSTWTVWIGDNIVKPDLSTKAAAQAVIDGIIKKLRDGGDVIIDIDDF